MIRSDMAQVPSVEKFSITSIAVDGNHTARVAFQVPFERLRRDRREAYSGQLIRDLEEFLHSTTDPADVGIIGGILRFIAGCPAPQIERKLGLTKPSFRYLCQVCRSKGVAGLERWLARRRKRLRLQPAPVTLAELRALSAVSANHHVRAAARAIVARAEGCTMDQALVGTPFTRRQLRLMWARVTAQGPSVLDRLARIRWNARYPELPGHQPVRRKGGE